MWVLAGKNLADRPAPHELEPNEDEGLSLTVVSTTRPSPSAIGGQGPMATTRAVRALAASSHSLRRPAAPAIE